MSNRPSTLSTPMPTSMSTSTPMPTSTLPFSRGLLLVSVLLGCWGLTTFGVLPSAAQNSQNPSSFDGSLRSNEPGSTIGGSNNGLNMFDLILRSQNTPSRTTDEFAEQQRRNLNTSSEEFRRQQLERIRNSEAGIIPSTSPTLPTSPTPTNP